MARQPLCRNKTCMYGNLNTFVNPTSRRSSSSSSDSSSNGTTTSSSSYATFKPKTI